MMKSLIGVAMVLLLGACGPGADTATPATADDRSPSPATTNGPSTAPSPPPPPQRDGETEVEVWFAQGHQLFGSTRRIAATRAVAAAAVQQVLDGPTGAESDAGVSTAVPDGTELLGITIDDGVATVDLSGEFDGGGGSLEESLRLSQVVYTVTQFPTVDGVSFEIEGEPVEAFGGHGIVLDDPSARRDWRDLVPAIVVLHPQIGQEVTSPVTIAGTANVFEATVSIRIRDASGNVVVETFTTATCGSGCRGEYSEEVAFDVAQTEDGVIKVFESSAEDGRPTNVVRIPVTLDG